VITGFGESSREAKHLVCSVGGVLLVAVHFGGFGSREGGAGVVAAVLVCEF